MRSKRHFVLYSLPGENVWNANDNFVYCRQPVIIRSSRRTGCYEEYQYVSHSGKWITLYEMRPADHPHNILLLPKKYCEVG